MCGENSSYLLHQLKDLDRVEMPRMFTKCQISLNYLTNFLFAENLCPEKHTLVVTNCITFSSDLTWSLPVHGVHLNASKASPDQDL